MTPIETQQAVATFVALTVAIPTIALAGFYAVVAIARRLFPR